MRLLRDVENIHRRRTQNTDGGPEKGITTGGAERRTATRTTTTLDQKPHPHGQLGGPETEKQPSGNGSGEGGRLFPGGFPQSALSS